MTRIPGLSLHVDDAAVPWVPTATPGVSWLVVAGQPGEGTARDAAVLIRMEPGRGYPPHRHVGVEEVLVLRGGYRDAFGTFEASSYVRYEAGSTHAPVALGDAERPAGPDNPACVLYAIARAGIEIVERGA